MELSRCEFINRRENVFALGPSGTGKTRRRALALRWSRKIGQAVKVYSTG